MLLQIMASMHGFRLPDKYFGPTERHIRHIQTSWQLNERRLLQVQERGKIRVSEYIACDFSNFLIDLSEVNTLKLKWMLVCIEDILSFINVTH